MWHLPSELLLSIYQHWLADIFDLSALDRACCNHGLRNDHLSFLSGTCIDFDFGTHPYTKEADQNDFLLWICNRQVHLVKLTVQDGSYGPIPGPLYISNLQMSQECSEEIVERIVSLVSIYIGWYYLMSDEWLQVFQSAMANSQTLTSVRLRDRASNGLSDDVLFSFLFSRKDTLKELELGERDLEFLRRLHVCHALEAITLTCCELDRATVLGFCGHFAHLQKLDLDCDLDASFVQDVLMTCPHLQSLKCVCCLTADMLNDILNRYPNLVYLSVENITITVKGNGNERSLGISDIGQFAESIIPQIQLPLHAIELDANYSHFIRLVGDRADSTLLSLVIKIEQLKKRSAAIKTMYNDILYTLQKCPNIQDFTLDCSNFNLAQMIAILTLLPNIRKLCLSDLHVENAPYNLVHALAKHTLYSLHLHGWKLDHGYSLANIVCALPGLQLLEVCECHNGGVDYLIELATLHLPATTTLLIDDEMMENLLEEIRSHGDDGGGATDAPRQYEQLKKLLKKDRLQSWSQRNPTLYTGSAPQLFVI